jgi:hypothetical protein
MKNDNRREFLKKSLIGISGAALIPAGITCPRTGQNGNQNPAYQFWNLRCTGYWFYQISL